MRATSLHRDDVHGGDIDCDHVGDVGRLAVRRDRDPGGALAPQIGTPGERQIGQGVRDQPNWSVCVSMTLTVLAGIDPATTYLPSGVT